MEQTTEEMVLNHKGYKTVVFLMEKDNHRFHQHWTMKIGENKTFTRRIRETFGVECVAIASYSMAPTLYADNVA